MYVAKPTDISLRIQLVPHTRNIQFYESKITERKKYIGHL